jgi:MFS family permease
LSTIGDGICSSTHTYGDAAAAPISAPHSGARNINSRDTAIAPGDIAVGVVIGRASEYFDFFVYAIASVLVFPAVFFPFADRLEGTLYSFAIFAIAYIARPIGTLVFMSIQRHFSREIKLTIALFLLGTATVAISALPTYSRWGEWAIISLACCASARVRAGRVLGRPAFAAGPERPRTQARMVRDVGTTWRTGRISSSPLACFPT